LADLRAGYLGVLDLQRVDPLLQVRRGPLNRHRVADDERAVREPDCTDADFPIKVEDLADFLSFHRNRA